jgi:hypothetical protein
MSRETLDHGGATEQGLSNTQADNHPSEVTPRGQMIGGTLFTVAIALCASQIVPGWSITIGWRPEVFFAIMAVCGVVAGFLWEPKHRIAGMVAGPIAGCGGLLAMALHLSAVTETYDKLVILIGLLGCLPGIGLFCALKRFAVMSPGPLEEHV